jgi:autotransporter-associated beta strand protein
VTLASGAHLATGNGTALGTLTLGNLTLGSGSAADFSFSATGNSMANLTGSLNLQGGGIDLFQTGTTVPFSVNGTYTLFNLPSVPANFNTLSVLDTVPNVTYAFGSTGTAITVTITGGQTSTAWAVDNSGSWGVAGNWTQGIPQGAGDIATLGPVISAPRTVTLDGARIVGSLVLNNSNSYTVAQGTGGNLTLATSGTGVAAIADLLGNHLISAPVIFQSDTTVTATNATDSVTLSGPLSGAGNITTAGLGTVILTGADAATGTTTIAGGTLQVGSGGTTGALPSGNVINNASLVFNLTGGTTAAPLVIANNIAGPGKLTFNGNNVRQLSGTNTFTGPINLNAGTLQAGSATAFGAGSATNVLVMAAGSTLDLNGNSNTVGSLSGAGTIDNTGAANVTLTTGAANASPTFSGVIQNSGVGTLGLTKNGSGLLTLSGINTYTGGTVINAGGILITNGNAFGTGTIQANTATGPSVGAGSIQLSDGVTLSNPIATIGSGSNEILGIASGTATVASNITSIGSTQYRVGTAGGTLIMTGTSTVGIASSNTSLISILTRGNIVVAGTGSMTNLFQAMTIGRQSSTSTANLTIQDNAVVQGVGVTLGGLNGTNDDTSTTVTLSGNGLLSAGTGAFDLNNSNTTGSVTLNVTGNSTVAGSAFTQTGTNENSTVVTFDGGTLLATGGDTATVPFIAASTTEAAFVVSGVTVQNVYSPTINIGAGGMKVNDGGFAITIAAALTTGNGADGGLTKLGSGSLTLTGSNSYTGNTTVTSGGLFVNAAGATSNGAVILNGGTLGGNASITGPVVPGTAAHSINPGAAGPNSIGTLTLNGGLTTNANTTLAFDLGSPDTAASPNGTSDLLAIPGTVTLSAGKLAVTSQTTTGGPSLGYYEVLSYGTLVGSTHGIVLPAAVNNVLYTLDTTQNPGFIDIHRGFIGDANDDGKVDLTDLNAVLNNLGTSNSSWSKGNFDGAATIDLTDLNDVLNNLGTSIASGSSVVASVAAPEPASLGLLALGAAALIARRRKA